jgi:hypothetical protein
MLTRRAFNSSITPSPSKPALGRAGYISVMTSKIYSGYRSEFYLSKQPEFLLPAKSAGNLTIFRENLQAPRAATEFILTSLTQTEGATKEEQA